MKKIFTLACLASAAMAMSAQSVFSVSPVFNDETAEDFSFLGEAMSANAKYVAGQDQMTSTPCVWSLDAETISVLSVIDNVNMPNEWDEDGNVISWYDEPMTRTGSFHAVTNNGLAVGSITNQETYVSYPVKFDATTGVYTSLKFNDLVESGGEGYAITADGQTIAGFYFNEAWTATACLWTEGGENRIDLPVVTEDEIGFPVDYVSARYMTSDGKKILGYAQDFYSGDWVAFVWEKQQDGSYAINCDMAKRLYQSRPYIEVPTEDGFPEMVYTEITDPKPFIQLEPLAISDNGEWVLAVVADYVSEDEGMSFFGAGKVVRYNLRTNDYEVIATPGDETSKLELFGVANNGTAVGRLTGSLDFDTWSQPVDAVVWGVGSTELITLADLYAEDEYVTGWAESALSSITPDATKVMGYSQTEFGTMSSFVVDLPDFVGVHSVLAPVAEGVKYDLSGRRANDSQKGIVIENRKAVLR